MAFRITTHRAKTTKNGEAFSARHLDRKFDISNAPHIDPSRTYLNRYMKFDVKEDGTLSCEEPKNIQAHEISVYKQLFQTSLEARNKKCVARRHKDERKTIRQYYASPKSCPDEYLIYIGDKDNHASSETLYEATMKLISVLEKKYHGYLVPLSASLHRDERGIGEDEEGSHIHFRCLWKCDTPQGPKVSISQGMKEAGIPLPQESAANSRYNNRLISFTKEIRETFADICEQDFGLEIERVAKDPTKAGKDLIIYQRDQALQDIQQFEQKNAEIQAEVAQSAQQAAKLQEEVEVLSTRKSNLTRALNRLAEIFLPVHRLFEKLGSIRIGNRTVLDDIIQDADTAKSYEALQKLAEWDER